MRRRVAKEFGLYLKTYLAIIGAFNQHEVNDMTAIREHERVVLTTDMPEEKLTTGDVGVVVHIHDEGKAYEVEFVALDGEIFAVVTLEHRHIRVVEQHEITHARRVA
jgi:hypothetical protein